MSKEMGRFISIFLVFICLFVLCGCFFMFMETIFGEPRDCIKRYGADYEYYAGAGGDVYCKNTKTGELRSYQ